MDPRGLSAGSLKRALETPVVQRNPHTTEKEQAEMHYVADGVVLPRGISKEPRQKRQGRQRGIIQTMTAAFGVLALAGFAGLTLTAGAVAQGASGGRLVLARGGDIDKLDPHQATAAQTFQTLELVYDNL